MNERSNLPETKEAQKAGDLTEQSKRRKVVVKSGGRGLLGIEPEQEGGIKRRDLLQFRWRPKEGPSLPMMLSTVNKSSGRPHKVASSKYQLLIKRLGTSCLICSTIGCKVRAKPRGPRGSPCCTPM